MDSNKENHKYESMLSFVSSKGDKKMIYKVIFNDEKDSPVYIKGDNIDEIMNTEMYPSKIPNDYHIFLKKSIYLYTDADERTRVITDVKRIESV